MRSTTGLDTVTLALFAFGATTGFIALFFLTSVGVAGGGDLNKTLVIVANMEAVLGDGLEWEA